MYSDLNTPLTDEQRRRLDITTDIFVIKDVMYVLYSENMKLHRKYLEDRFDKENASVDEMLRYCQMNDIKVEPYVYKNATKENCFSELRRIEEYNCDIKAEELHQQITWFLLEVLFVNDLMEDDQ